MTLARLLLLTTLATPAAADAATEEAVDLALVLAVDMSGSMDAQEHALQRGGYVAAIRSPEVWRAIETGAWRRIALSYLEWAGAASQVVVMDWRLIDSPEAARVFADDLEAQPLSRIRGTSISGAIDRAAALLDSSGFDAWRRVIDISGDGANNRGRPVTEARDDALARGITINGLPIMLRPSFAEGDLAAYYAACVIGGPGAFALPVRSEAAMADAIRRKLVQEIAALPPPALPAQATQGAPVDCMVGERVRRRYLDP